MMNINFYRRPNGEGAENSWSNCQFSSDTDLTGLTVKPLVTINRQPFLRQHHVTYLTGRETCHAHHFAKLLAAKHLANPSTHTASPCKLLWIDTLHGPHIAAQIYRELSAHAPSRESLHFVCLDILGSQRDNFYALNRNIEELIRVHKPELVVIDDIDHFMPFSGVTTATEFCRIVRDATNHSETAFLFIGYNHLGKRASTTGNLGKYLFLDASDVFALSTQGGVTTVRLVNSYDMSVLPDDSQFRFTIGADNLPHEAVTKNKPAAQVNQQTQETKQEPPQDGVAVNNNTVPPGPLCRDKVAALTPNDLPHSINTSLTLPPSPLRRPCTVCGDVVDKPLTTDNAG